MNEMAQRAEPRLGEFPGSWPETAQLVCLTGGTTAAPRQVVYDAAHWARSVKIKTEMLRAHGVGPGSRVAVCHPFDPWSIGAVHRDAALACGATVLPLGLSASTQSMQRQLMDFDPTIVCGTASLLIRWWEEARLAGVEPIGAPEIVFHAGEPLRDADREACARLLGARIVNVYGLAQFDAIACELPGCEGLVLAPDYEYRICRDGCMNLPAAGVVGELALRSRSGGAWHHTGDQVRVTGMVSSHAPQWQGSPSIAHLGRLDHVVSLPDGSVLSGAQVLAAEAALADAGVVKLQVQIWRPPARQAEVRIMASVRDGSSLSPERIRARLLEAACDLADAETHGAVRVVAELAPESRFLRTARGKLPAVIAVDEPCSPSPEVST